MMYSSHASLQNWELGLALDHTQCAWNSLPGSPSRRTEYIAGQERREYGVLPVIIVRRVIPMAQTSPSGVDGASDAVEVMLSGAINSRVLPHFDFVPSIIKRDEPKSASTALYGNVPVDWLSPIFTDIFFSRMLLGLTSPCTIWPTPWIYARLQTNCFATSGNTTASAALRWSILSSSYFT